MRKVMIESCNFDPVEFLNIQPGDHETEEAMQFALMDYIMFLKGKKLAPDTVKVYLNDL